MKIGIDLVTNKSINGTEIYSINLVKELVRVSPEIQICIFVNYRIYEYYKSQLNIYPNIELKPVKVKSEILLIIFQQAILPFYILQKRIKTLYSPSLFYSWLAPCRKIVTIHDAAYARYKEYRNIFSKAYINLNMFFTRLFRTDIVTCSEFGKAEILNFYKFNRNKIIVVPFLWEDTSNLTVSGDENKSFKYFLYIGNAHGRKNLKNIIEGFQIFSESFPEVKLVFAGTSSKSDRVTELCNQLKLSSKVIYSGIVTEVEKWTLLRNAISLVFVSLYEGFGIPILEAQSVDCPVITSNIGVMPETAGQGAVYADPNSPTGISNQMLKIYSDSNLRNKLQEYGKVNLARFSNSGENAEFKKFFLRGHN